jgi:hypothetical protein
MLKELIQLIGGSALLAVVWTAAPCSQDSPGLRLFTTAYVVIVYIVSHYDRFKLP